MRGCVRARARGRPTPTTDRPHTTDRPARPDRPHSTDSSDKGRGRPNDRSTEQAPSKHPASPKVKHNQKQYGPPRLPFDCSRPAQKGSKKSVQTNGGANDEAPRVLRSQDGHHVSHTQQHYHRPRLPDACFLLVLQGFKSIHTQTRLTMMDHHARHHRHEITHVIQHITQHAVCNPK